ncbi:GAK system ATP-grasp enzyme [Thiohalophilus sp.]|uniref:GAK system ATP-grasp enzyme n=1 Tax=Thiohalophilus sp. TaxID=3028392 RepID=UPI0039762FD1
MTNIRIGVVGIPGKWSTDILADAIEQRTGFRLVIDMAQVELDMQNNQLLFQNRDLCQLDGLLVKKISNEYSPAALDRLELLRVAEVQGVRVFSGVENMLRLINRLSCTITLRNNGIPMPDTCITENIDAAMATIKQFGSAVFKPLFSTKARGMMLIESAQPEDQLRSSITDFQRHNPMMYIQRKIVLPGHDLGMVFLGGNYLGTYARVSQTEAWNTTIHSGGHYAAYTPSEDMIALARRAQAPFNMDFTTVDVAESEHGPIVFEVSAFGGFRGALQGANIDAATAYADYALARLAG